MKIVLSLLITTILGCTSMHAQEVLYTRDRNLPCIERKFYVYVHIILDSLRQPGISDVKIKAHLAEANKAFENWYSKRLFIQWNKWKRRNRAIIHKVSEKTKNKYLLFRFGNQRTNQFLFFFQRYFQYRLSSYIPT